MAEAETVRERPPDDGGRAHSAGGRGRRGADPGLRVPGRHLPAVPQRRGRARRGGLPVPPGRGGRGVRLRGPHRRAPGQRARSRSARRPSRPTTTPWPRGTGRTCSTRSGPTSSRRAWATCSRGRRSSSGSPRWPSCPSRATPSGSRLPTTIAPRYAPPEDRKGVGETEAERGERALAPCTCPTASSCEVDVRDERAACGRCESPTHPIAVAVEDGRATVKPLDPRRGPRPGLRPEASTSPRPSRPGPWWSRARRARLRPGVLPPGARREAGVRPRSSSWWTARARWRASSIAEARNALQLALRSLRPGCLFNIVGFGSTHETLFPESRAYDDASLAEATAARAGPRRRPGRDGDPAGARGGPLGEAPQGAARASCSSSPTARSATPTR